jgi:hypothetical protein
MTTREKITITNHPVLTEVTREVQVFRSYKEYDVQRVVLVLNVFHYDSEGNAITYFPKQVELIASNTTFVNPQDGQILQPDEDGNYPEGAMGEYDYLWYIVNVQKAYTEVELEDMYAGLRIEQINKKLYGE